MRKKRNPCKATTRAGNPCRGKPTGRSKYCVSHSKKRKSKNMRRKNPAVGVLHPNPIIPVYLASHGKGEPRMVRVPDDTPEDDLLDQTFHYGQNEFQRQTAPSVSVGDVIRLPDGSLHRVMFAGFKRLPDDYNPLTLTGQDAWSDGYNFPSKRRNRNFRNNPRRYDNYGSTKGYRH